MNLFFIRFVIVLRTTAIVLIFGCLLILPASSQAQQPPMPGQAFGDSPTEMNGYTMGQFGTSCATGIS